VTSPRLSARARRKSAAALVLTAVALGASGVATAPALAAGPVTVTDSMARPDYHAVSRPETRAQLVGALERKVLNSPEYVAPVNGPITQWYGSHPGLDIAPPFGTPIVAAHSGVVTFVGWQDGYGMHVEVTQVDGIVTTYSHMSAWSVQEGQLVVAGQELGNVGSTGWSTGPHLHFEVHLPNGERTDPALWLLAHRVLI
jgi:murein DD-endopeptidase MepM/ murein hydrolase activator NlpD